MIVPFGPIPAVFEATGKPDRWSGAITEARFGLTRTRELGWGVIGRTSPVVFPAHSLAVTFILPSRESAARAVPRSTAGCPRVGDAGWPASAIWKAT